MKAFLVRWKLLDRSLDQILCTLVWRITGEENWWIVLLRYPVRVKSNYKLTMTKLPDRPRIQQTNTEDVFGPIITKGFVKLLVSKKKFTLYNTKDNAIVRDDLYPASATATQYSSANKPFILPSLSIIAVSTKGYFHLFQDSVHIKC